VTTAKLAVAAIGPAAPSDSERSLRVLLDSLGVDPNVPISPFLIASCSLPRMACLSHAASHKIITLNGHRADAQQGHPRGLAFASVSLPRSRF